MPAVTGAGARGARRAATSKLVAGSPRRDPHGVVPRGTPNYDVLMSKNGNAVRNRRRTSVAATCGLALFAALSRGASPFAGETTGQPGGNQPPNIVIITADDLGWGDLGSYGHPNIRTPHLDRMAAEGQRWTSFYSQAPVCTPSRAALLTGRIHLRSGMFGRRWSVLLPDSPTGLPANEITVAEVLRDAGYATGIVGKWHLGHLPEYLPTRHGFDSWLGIPYSNDMDSQLPSDAARLAAMFDPRPDYWHVPLMRDEIVVERPADQYTLTRRYAEEAVSFIEAHRDEAFFLYLPHTMPHVPLFPSGDFRGRSTAGVYGDVIEEIDWAVGQVLEALERLELAERTLVVFTSDNGPWIRFETHGGSAGPLRHGKETTFEGGMRVPGLFWWPGTIAPGVVRDIGSAMDLFTTAIVLGGGVVPDDRPIDGIDLSPVLMGTGASPRETMAYYRMGELFAFRLGPYKAHFTTEGRYGLEAERTDHDPPLLFDLREDVGERYDVAEERPDALAAVVAAAERHSAGMTVGEPLFDLRGPE